MTAVLPLSSLSQRLNLNQNETPQQKSDAITITNQEQPVIQAKFSQLENPHMPLDHKDSLKLKANKLKPN